MSILENELRIGRFTSSEIYKLMSFGTREMTQSELDARPKKGKGSKGTTVIDYDSFGQGALTYIEEKRMERRLGRALQNEASAKPLQWGIVAERLAFELLGTDYKLRSQETTPHPTLGEFWCGSIDMNKFEERKIVAEIKSPFTLKSFCTLIDAGNIDAIRELHDDGEKYFWQGISNAIITESDFVELVIFCPYREDLKAIRDLCELPEYQGSSWVKWADDCELPYLCKDRHYKDLNIIRWEVKKEDKDLLTKRVIEASKLLTK